MADVISRWDPGRELSTLRDDLERMFRQAFGWAPIDESSLSGAFSPALDFEETEDAYVIHAETPGVKPDDIHVSLDDDMLTISGERRFYEERSAEDFRRVERRFGTFRRSLRLPGHVEAGNVEAAYRDGVLMITVPKAAEAKPHRIEVKAEA